MHWQENVHNLIYFHCCSIKNENSPQLCEIMRKFKKCKFEVGRCRRERTFPNLGYRYTGMPIQAPPVTVDPEPRSRQPDSRRAHPPLSSGPGRCPSHRKGASVGGPRRRQTWVAKKDLVELELRTYLNLRTYNSFEMLKYNLEIAKKWKLLHFGKIGFKIPTKFGKKLAKFSNIRAKFANFG